MANNTQPISTHPLATNNSNQYFNLATYSETSTMSQDMSTVPNDLVTIDLVTVDLTTIDFANQQALAIQHILCYQSTQLNEFRFFYQNYNNYYHVTCKMISENPSLDDDDYDYEFFDLTTRYHVMCKKLRNSLVLNLLNKEIYGIDFDVNELKRKYPLTLQEKLNLELSLKLYLGEMTNASLFMTTQTVSMVDNQNHFDNSLPTNDCIVHQDGQDVDGAGDYTIPQY